MTDEKRSLTLDFSSTIDSVAREVREIEIILNQSAAGRTHVEIMQSPDNRFGEAETFEPKIAAAAL